MRPTTPQAHDYDPYCLFCHELLRTMGKDNGSNRIIVEINRTIVKVSECGGAPADGWGEGVAMTTSKIKLSVFHEN